MKRLLSGALVSVVLAAAGCGGEENDAYADDVNALYETYDAELGALDPNPRTIRDVRELAARGAALDSELAADVATVDPPGDVADLHAELVSLLEDAARTSQGLSALASSSASQDRLRREARAATEELERTNGRITALIERINDEL